MPSRRAPLAEPRLAVVEQLPAPVKKPEFNLGNSLAVAIIGLLVSLMGTGIVSMVVLYANVSRLTEAQMRTEAQLSKHLDHAVDRDSYEAQTKEIKRSINDKASKDELTELRQQVKEQLIDLKEMIQTVQQAYSGARRR